MTRDPSLHVKASTLKAILKEVVGIIDLDYDKLTHMIMQRARPHSISNRLIVVSSDQVAKKVNYINRSSQKDADVMAKIIMLTRRSMKHVGVRLIEPTSRDWSILKNLTDLANQFCNEFELKKSDGYRAFISIGICKTSKFNLPKLVGMYESICETYAATKEIESDPTPEQTVQVHAYYRIKVAEKTGIVNTYANMPEKYVCFVRVKQLVKELGIGYKDYIDSQFSMMEYRGALPDPYQLLGDKAKARLNKYLYQNK